MAKRRADPGDDHLLGRGAVNDGHLDVLSPNASFCGLKKVKKQKRA